MLDTARNDSLSHRDANCAADALMLLLRGRSSSSNKVAHISSSNCAIAAAFAFSSCWSLILGGSKMGYSRGRWGLWGGSDEGDRGFGGQASTGFGTVAMECLERESLENCPASNHRYEELIEAPPPPNLNYQQLRSLSPIHNCKFLYLSQQILTCLPYVFKTVIRQTSLWLEM